MAERRVMFVDCDGVRLDRLLEAATPHLDGLAARGQFAPSYIQDGALARTLSGPGHANLLTGVWPDKHRALDNTFDGARFDAYPDLFTRLGDVAPHLSTFSTADWEPLNDCLIGTPDVKLQQRGPDQVTTDRQSVDAAVEALSGAGPDVLFVYLHDADATGHELGSESADYLAAVERVDAQIGRLVAAVEARATYADEDWLWLVSTDHGQVGNGHGGDEPEVRTIWMLAAGGDVAAGAVREWRQVDVVPTILRHLGLSVDPAWDLDGVAIGTPSADPFDAATGELPDGWILDGTGWSLTTGPQWCAAEPLWGRGSFVRGRDTIAVADSAHGAVDSTIWSPWVEASSRDLTVEYLSHCRQVGDGQQARVVVELDDGTVDVIWSADCLDGEHFDISTPMRLAVRTSSAGRRRVGWRLEASEPNGYWAIDDVRISSGS